MTEHEALIAEVRESAKQLPAPATARWIRRAARVSQSRLAQAVGVDRTTIARWEAGACEPRGVQRSRYADILEALQKELAA